MIKFYECKTCGNIIVLLEDKGVIPTCCGSTMVELKPQVNDGKEKHVPVIECKDDEVIVKVGEVAHPMENEHYIKWILLETDKGQYIRYLKPGEEPIAKFKLCCTGEKCIAAYEFCNIHSLWMKQV